MASNLTQLDPFNDIAHFSPLRGFEDFLKDFRLRPGFSNFEAEPRIKMDVSETDQGYIVKAEIPRVKKEDVKVAVDGNQITITAESKHESEEKKGESLVRRERYFGHQSRSFTLAHEIDNSKAIAKYQDGVLELTLPKKEGNSDTKMLTIT